VSRVCGASDGDSWRGRGVFEIDVLKCDCGGDLKPLGAVQNPEEVRRYLKHCNIEYDPPPRGPPKLVQDCFEFDQTPALEEYQDSFDAD